MKKIEIRAKTVEDAITEASLQLGVTSDKLAYDVIDEGSAGFLGIGKKDAVITAYRKDDEMRDQREAARKKQKAMKEAVKAEVEKTADPEADSVSATEEPKDEAVSRKNSDNKDGSDRSGRKKSGRKQSGKKNRRSGNRRKNDSYDDYEAGEEIVPSQPKKQKEIVPMTEDNVRACEDYLKSILKEMGLDAEVSSREEEDHSLYMNVTGDNMGLIIGKRGQTLDALQYLLNRVASHNQEGSVRIKLDTEDYRERRKKTLENLARNIAAKAKKTNRSVVLEPMNPYERMIIHSALQKDPAVTTYSKGKEPYRTVVVALKRD